MKRAWSARARVALVALSAWASSDARADEAPPSDGAGGSTAAPDAPKGEPDADEAARMDAAKQRFFKGLELFKAEKWGAALAEFEESIRIHPTRSATRNAALCLRKLDRYAEALTRYEELASAFEDPDESERAIRQRETEELHTLVGTLAITCSEQGATLTVDGLERGVTPLAAPLRVNSGTHRIEAYKDGYLLESQEISVAGRANADVRVALRPLALSGRLRVAEKDGHAASVLVDDVRVGSAPWEGALAPGTHHVTLRGAGTQGSEPAAAPVRVGEITRLTVGLEDLGGAVAVYPVPATATVVIDGVEVGRGIWQGALKLGPHRVELASEGFIPLERKVDLVDDEPVVLRLSLERDRTSGVWQVKKQPRFVIDLALGPAIGPTFGGEVVPDECGARCSVSPTYGAFALVDAGYRFPVGISLGVGAGYLFLRQRVDERPGALMERPDALRVDAGVIDDVLSMHAFIVGASVGFDTGEKVFFRGRLTTGAAIAAVTDRRTGAFVSAIDGSAYSIPAIAEPHDAQFFAVVPDVHLGYRVTRAFEIGASVYGLGLIALGAPTWENEEDVRAPGFLGFFEEERLFGSSMFVVAPTVDATLSF